MVNKKIKFWQKYAVLLEDIFGIKLVKPSARMIFFYLYFSEYLDYSLSAQKSDYWFWIFLRGCLQTLLSCDFVEKSWGSAFLLSKTPSAVTLAPNPRLHPSPFLANF